MEITSRFEDALQFAVHLHRDQYRKGTTTPYVSHLLAVAGLVMEFGGDEDQAVAALLHDTIEDQSKSFGGADALHTEIKHRFGEGVLAIVEQCTDAEVIPKPPWKARKEGFISRVSLMTQAAALTSICDKLHNARTILVDVLTPGSDVFNRFNGKIDGTLWYYESAAKAFLAAFPQPASKELARVVSAMASTVRPGSAGAQLLNVHERPPFMPGDEYEEWQLPPDSHRSEIAILRNGTTKKYWLRLRRFSFSADEPSELVWGELTSEEALSVSSNTAEELMQSRRVFVDKDGTLSFRPATKLAGKGSTDVRA